MPGGNANQTPLFNLGNAVLNGLIAAYHTYGRVATGKTARDTQLVIIDENHIQIVGPAYLMQLEKGRGATGMGPHQRFGGLTFKESLKLWMEARGIEDKAFWPIYITINKKGFAGTPGVISKPLGESAIGKAIQENLSDIATLYATQVFNALFK